jgi:tRNA pseudouridine55 synthase
MNGVVLIDKPAGCTSHDVVNQWRRLAGTKRVGHLGTLDPMATGLLALVTGSATRLAQFIDTEEKTYEAEIAFGMTSNTYDVEGELTRTEQPVPEPVAIEDAIGAFRGRFWQTPPAVSAKKIQGVPAYKLARKNIAVELKPVEVEVKALQVRAIQGARLLATITCSAGTYIRSIAHDLGQRLGCGAVLANLRRTRIGAFTIERARTLEQLRALAQAGDLAAGVVNSGQVLTEYPAEYYDELGEARIRQGRNFRTSPFVVPPGALRVRALSRDGELIAIGELVIPNLYHPLTVLPHEPQRAG